jgi:hypothetical protein
MLFESRVESVLKTPNIFDSNLVVLVYKTHIILTENTKINHLSFFVVTEQEARPDIECGSR